MSSSSSLGWIKRGVRSKEVLSRSKLQRIETKKLKKTSAKSSSPDELRQIYKISYGQIESGALMHPFKGADEVLNTKPLTSFEDLPEKSLADVVRYLKEIRQFDQPTQIQRAAIPLGLKNISFAAQAPTGSGKTLAFLIPVVHNIVVGNGSSNIWILSPTRELLKQTKDVLDHMLRYVSGGEEGGAGVGTTTTTSGGGGTTTTSTGSSPTDTTSGSPTTTPLSYQILEVKSAIHMMMVSESPSSPPPSAKILLCTPHGIAYMIKKLSKKLSKKNLKSHDLMNPNILVLDEVDALLEGSLLRSCDEFLRELSSPLQVMAFTASLKSRGKVIEYLSQILPPSSPIIKIDSLFQASDDQIEISLINCGGKGRSGGKARGADTTSGRTTGDNTTTTLSGGGATTTTRDHFDEDDELCKRAALSQLIDDHEIIPPTIIFVQDKHRALSLRNYLKNHPSFRSMPEDIISLLHNDMAFDDRAKAFKKFQSGKLWILICTDLASRGLDFKNCKLVLNYDLPFNKEIMIHRIGRTGRQNLKGKSIIFYTTKDQNYITNVLNPIINGNKESV